MKRLSVMAAVMIALAAPVSASTVSSVGSNATLSPSGGTWRLNAEAVRASRLRTRSRSIYRTRNQNRGVRTQDPRTPIYAIGDTRGLGRLFNFGSLFGGGSNSPFFNGGTSGQNQVLVVAVDPEGAVVGGINVTDIFTAGDSTAPTGSGVSVVPVPASLPLLIGGIGLLAFIRRRA